MFACRTLSKMLMALVFAVLVSSAAQAQTPATVAGPKDERGLGRGESFAVPTTRELALTSLMLEAYDSNSNSTIDEYAKLMYCSLYQEKYKSDFEWNSVRQELTRKLQGKREYFRTHYEVAGTIYLGRYSFETQDFPFEKGTALVNVGSLTLLSANNMDENVRLCGEAFPSTMFPNHYLFVLQQPLTLDRLKMPMDEAEVLLKRMELMNNKERALYIRFRVRLLGSGAVNSRGARRSLLMRGDLVGVDLFYDREMTKHFAVISLK